MSLRAAGGQIQGKRRRQEDAWRLERYGDDELLAVIADGLGGHPCGDVASREAVREFVEQFGARRALATAAPRVWLQEATVATDHALKAMQRADRKLREMATTLVAIYVRGAEFSAVSVGDSYLLLLRERRLMRLNALHAEDGGVTSCVGFNLSRVDVADRLAVMRGDRFLLATDGIVTLEDDEVAACLGNASDAEAAVIGMLQAVDRADLPKQDNVTAVVLLA
ncbi:MAG: PP2C family protein-serine/threonine phosphatase [Gammaproteobacteria bacterium]